MLRFEQEILNAAPAPPAPLHPRIPSVSCSGSGKVDVLIDRVTHSYFKDIALTWKGGGDTQKAIHMWEAIVYIIVASFIAQYIQCWNTYLSQIRIFVGCIKYYLQIGTKYFELTLVII